jgi:hypothetical protein
MIKKIFNSMDSGDWIALLAFLLSVSSLSINGIEYRKTTDLQLTNLQNSVRPYIVIDKNASSQENPLGISLRNEGLGPAIIDTLSVKFDGREMPMDSILSFSEKIHLSCFKDTNDSQYTWWDVGAIPAVGAGKEHWLLKIENTKDKKHITNFPNFDTLLTSHVTVGVKYHSIMNVAYYQTN